jgi:hypothetical protein
VTRVAYFDGAVVLARQHRRGSVLERERAQQRRSRDAEQGGRGGHGHDDLQPPRGADGARQQGGERRAAAAQRGEVQAAHLDDDEDHDDRQPDDPGALVEEDRHPLLPRSADRTPPNLVHRADRGR